jgi:hypothetical protein
MRDMTSLFTLVLAPLTFVEKDEEEIMAQAGVKKRGTQEKSQFVFTPV